MSEAEKTAPKKKKNWTIGPLKDFKQQECPSCIAIMRPIPLSICFFLLGVLCLILGVIWIISAAFAYNTEAFRYDNLCEMNEKCTFRFEVEHDLEKPVYLYYRIEGYYQAYRRYIKSRSDAQLMDENVNDYDKLGDCSPMISLNDDNDKSDVYLPCGLIALSFFNDTFTIMKDNGGDIKQSSDDINFDIYENLFKDPGVDTEGIRVVNSFENPHFITWMNVAALPNFLKIYAIIDEDIPKGHYLMEVENHYPVRNYDAKKFFKLSTTTWIGGRNFFLGVVLLIVGTISFVFSCCVCIKTKGWENPETMSKIKELLKKKESAPVSAPAPNVTKINQTPVEVKLQKELVRPAIQTVTSPKLVPITRIRTGFKVPNESPNAEKPPQIVQNSATVIKQAPAPKPEVSNTRQQNKVLPPKSVEEKSSSKMGVNLDSVDRDQNYYLDAYEVELNTIAASKDAKIKNSILEQLFNLDGTISDAALYCFGEKLPTLSKEEFNSSHR